MMWSPSGNSALPGARIQGFCSLSSHPMSKASVRFVNRRACLAINSKSCSGHCSQQLEQSLYIEQNLDDHSDESSRKTISGSMHQSLRLCLESETLSPSRRMRFRCHPRDVSAEPAAAPPPATAPVPVSRRIFSPFRVAVGPLGQPLRRAGASGKTLQPGVLCRYVGSV